MVTTLAQNAQSGTTIIKLPSGLVADPAGNIYVALWGTSVIGKITPTGTVSVLAGSEDSRGNVDGIGSAARFNLPNDITIDAQGNLYVTDQNNNSIRKITPDGAVTTIAGSPAGAAGYQDGSAALFNVPQGIKADASGNLLIVDRQNHKIRKISNAFLSVDLNEIRDSSLKMYPVAAKDILNLSFNKKNYFCILLYAFGTASAGADVQRYNRSIEYFRIGIRNVYS